ncbi:TPA: hypothetical protein N0F65_008745 [Lagenidium giganteum]|uniref:DDE Tnp4 domain-containing protein n=1 Tax=Lagenidium giganteum TaxID=4803 RepID=A0AAV2Z3F3_9STRA|nr:TPA: hypothetical protein N0F65_008745 [Lagenidium giganteum]
MAYPNRLVDLEHLFGYSSIALSKVCGDVLTHIHNKFKFLFRLSSHGWSREDLGRFSRAVEHKGAPISCCVGFIDGTCYNGHKRKHGIKFQSLVAPNGLIAHLHGPLPASRHDAYVLSDSKLLQDVVDAFDGGNFVIYGDPAYGRQQYLLSPFKGSRLTAQQERFNAAMSKVRICVEWEFGKLVRYWAICDHARNQKLQLQPCTRWRCCWPVFLYGRWVITTVRTYRQQTSIVCIAASF